MPAGTRRSRFYGVGDVWCFSCGGFAGHVKLTFGRGTSLTPVPAATPIGMGKDSRGVELTAVDDIDERQLASWMIQATLHPRFRREESMSRTTVHGSALARAIAALPTWVAAAAKMG